MRIKFQSGLGVALGFLVSLAVDAATHAARLASSRSGAHVTVNKEAKFVGPKTPLENRTWYFAKLVADGLVGCDDAEALSWEFGKELAARHKNIDRNKFSAYLDVILQGKSTAGAETRFLIRDEIVQWANAFFDEVRARYEIPSEAYSNALIDQLKDHRNYAPETKVAHFAKQTLAHVQKIAEIQKSSGTIKCGDKTGDDLARFRNLVKATDRRLLGSSDDKATVQPLLFADVVKVSPPAEVPPAQHTSSPEVNEPSPAATAQAETAPLAARSTTIVVPAPSLVTAHQNLYMGAIVNNSDRSAAVRLSQLNAPRGTRIIVPIPAPSIDIETIRPAEPAPAKGHDAGAPNEGKSVAADPAVPPAREPVATTITVPAPHESKPKVTKLPPPPKPAKPLKAATGGQTTTAKLPPSPTKPSPPAARITVPSTSVPPAPQVRSTPPPSSTPRIDAATVHAVAQSVTEVTPGSAALRRARNWDYNLGPELWRTVDQCFDVPNNFADQISFFTAEHTKPTNGAEVAPSGDGDTDVTFLSHAFCDVTEESLNADISRGVGEKTAAKRYAGPQTTANVRSFIAQYNALQAAARTGPAQMKQFHKLTTAFTTCLASTESMTSADNFDYFTSNRTSRKKKADEIAIALGLAPKDTPNAGALLPSGLELYFDSETWVIGAYQFSTDEMNQCVYNWNKLYPSCAIPAASDKRMRSLILSSSPKQSFNIFCGINSLAQSLKSQANSRQSHRIPATSSVSAAPANRCVSLFVGATHGRMRFGPMQNTTGDNLNEVVTCTLKSFRDAN